MATKKSSKERGSNYGGENHGVRVQYPDGTWGFVQAVALSDPADPDRLASVVNSELAVRDDATVSVLSCLQQILEEQRKMNMFLEGLTQ